MSGQEATVGSITNKDPTAFDYGLLTSILWATVAFHFDRHVEGATESQLMGFLKVCRPC